MGRLSLRFAWPAIPRPRIRPPRRPSAETVTDLAFLAGLAAVAAGCGWIYPPAAALVGGALLAAVAWRAGRGDPPAQEPTRNVERWYSVDEED